MEMEYKTHIARLEEVKSEGERTEIKAYVLAFGNIDSYGDIILPNACDAFLEGEMADRMALCYQHDRTRVIGRIDEKGVDEHGLWIKATIANTTDGRDVAELLKLGALKEFSIGYHADKASFKDAEDGSQIRLLEAITIYEASPVTIAANAQATLVSVKADEAETEVKEIETETEIEVETESTNNLKSEAIMQEEMKTMQASIEAMNEKFNAMVEEQKSSINNLDESIKVLNNNQKSLNEKMSAKSMTFAESFREALESNREAIKAAFEKKADKFDINLELKAINGIGSALVTPGHRVGVMDDPTIYAAVPAGNEFLAVLTILPRTSNKLGWLEATAQSGAGYVAELAQNTNKSDVSFAEKTRNFAKIATWMQISTEFEDWFEKLYQYCVTEGTRLINNKVNELVYGGLGNDSTKQNEIYGLKNSATAFAALAAGVVEQANEADVIADAVAQVRKNGYNANVAFVTYPIWRVLSSLKDTTGQYLLTNGILNGIRIVPSAVLGANEILVLDTACAKVYQGNSFELEFIRNGAYDAYDVFFRKAVQVLVSEPQKKGIIYVSNTTTAKAALQKGA